MRFTPFNYSVFFKVYSIQLFSVFCNIGSLEQLSIWYERKGVLFDCNLVPKTNTSYIPSTISALGFNIDYVVSKYLLQFNVYIK